MTDRAITYRQDIDGLRAIAVSAVIAFHAGWMPNGFLGVDIFFVISGFLITSIIYKQLREDRFSLVDFYLRRTRRIIPLTLFVSGVALVWGMFVMLPDDLENLGQSVIATVFSMNNVLQWMTTGNYWDVVNDYKPLMHTWSLGVEEQYYVVYPFLLLLCRGRRLARLLPFLAMLAAFSLAAAVLPGFSQPSKFYLIFFRFWELSAGGIAAILTQDGSGRKILRLSPDMLVAALVGLLLLPPSALDDRVLLFLTVVVTCQLLMQTDLQGLSGRLLRLPSFVFIGKLSFSLYMWHQVLFAFARYCWTQELHVAHLAVLIPTMLILSIGTYYAIETPFRDRNRIGLKTLGVSIAAAGLLLLGVSAPIVRSGGVIRDVPELEIVQAAVAPGMHAKYNDRIYGLNRDFASSDKIRVLVIGNSFARDWANVLLESPFADRLEVSYVYHFSELKGLKPRVAQAEVIFWSMADPQDVQASGVDVTKLWVIGTKSFGVSNGIFYNHQGDDYLHQRTFMEKGVFEENERLREHWAERYLDLIHRISDHRQTVPVFTPEGKFISQDCRHLTKAGAEFFSRLFASQHKEILFGSSLARRQDGSGIDATTSVGFREGSSQDSQRR